MIQDSDITVIENVMSKIDREAQLNEAINYSYRENRRFHRKNHWKFTFHEVAPSGKTSTISLLFYPKGNFKDIENRFHAYVQHYMYELFDKLDAKAIDLAKLKEDLRYDDPKFRKMVDDIPTQLSFIK